MHIKDSATHTSGTAGSPQTPIQAAQHQLRNKLGIVMGSIDIVRTTEALSSDGLADLVRMKRACEEILNLVEALSRLESRAAGSPQT